MVSPSLPFTFYLFLIIPYCIIVPRFEAHIATYNCDYFTSIRHFFNSLFSVLAVVLVALIKTLSHKIALNRDAPRAYYEGWLAPRYLYSSSATLIMILKSPPVLSSIIISAEYLIPGTLCKIESIM